MEGKRLESRRCPNCSRPPDQTAYCNRSNRFEKSCTRDDPHVHHLCQDCKINWVDPEKEK